VNPAIKTLKWEWSKSINATFLGVALNSFLLKIPYPNAIAMASFISFKTFISSCIKESLSFHASVVWWHRKNEVIVSNSKSFWQSAWIFLASWGQFVQIRKLYFPICIWPQSKLCFLHWGQSYCKRIWLHLPTIRCSPSTPKIYLEKRRYVWS